MNAATESRCGRCGRPEDAHQGADRDETEILLARLGCKGFAVSRAAVATAKTATHAPASSPLCHRCWRQGHTEERCTA